MQENKRRRTNHQRWVVFLVPSGLSCYFLPAWLQGKFCLDLRLETGLPIGSIVSAGKLFFFPHLQLSGTFAADISVPSNTYVQFNPFYPVMSYWKGKPNFPRMFLTVLVIEIRAEQKETFL